MTAASQEERTLQAVARVAEVLEARGVRFALVGGAALAVHGYPASGGWSRGAPR